MSPLFWLRAITSVTEMTHMILEAKEEGTLPKGHQEIDAALGMFRASQERMAQAFDESLKAELARREDKDHT